MPEPADLTCYALAAGLVLVELRPESGRTRVVARTAGETDPDGPGLVVADDVAWYCDEVLVRWDLRRDVVERGTQPCEGLARTDDGVVVWEGTDARATRYLDLEAAFEGTGGEAHALLSASRYAAVWGDLFVDFGGDRSIFASTFHLSGRWNHVLELRGGPGDAAGLTATGRNVLRLEDVASDHEDDVAWLRAHDLEQGSLRWEAQLDRGGRRLVGLDCGCAAGAASPFGDNDLDDVLGVEEGGLDCDDADPTVQPGADERCDGIDQDCDARVDEDACAEVRLTSDELGPWIVPDGGTITFADARFTADDVTGDGRDDLVVASPSHAPDGRPSAGAIWILGGPFRADTTLRIATVGSIDGPEPEVELGSSLLALGDVDGDGYPDLGAGAPYNKGFGDEGAFYLLGGPFLGASTPEALALRVFTGTSGLAWLGSEAAVVPALLAEGENAVALRACAIVSHCDVVVFPLREGADAWAAQAEALLDAGPDELDAGRRLAAGGDTDGDGMGEVLVSGAMADVGRVWRVEGPLAGPLSLADAPALVGGDMTEDYGAAFAGLGDVDGDGYDDIAVGLTMPLAGAGRVDVLRGPLPALGGESDAAGRLHGSAWDARMGAVIFAPGDVDGDGRADLAVTEENGDGEGVGTVHLVLGPLTGSLVPALSVEGTAPGEGLGHRLGRGLDLGPTAGPNLLVGASSGETGLGAIGVFTWPPP